MAPRQRQPAHLPITHKAGHSTHTRCLWTLSALLCLHTPCMEPHTLCCAQHAKRPGCWQGSEGRWRACQPTLHSPGKTPPRAVAQWRPAPKTPRAQERNMHKARRPGTYSASHALASQAGASVALLLSLSLHILNEYVVSCMSHQGPTHGCGSQWQDIDKTSVRYAATISSHARTSCWYIHDRRPRQPRQKTTVQSGAATGAAPISLAGPAKPGKRNSSCVRDSTGYRQTLRWPKAKRRLWRPAYTAC